MICLWNNSFNLITYFDLKNEKGFFKNEFEDKIRFVDSLHLVTPIHINKRGLSQSPLMFWI